MEDWPWWRKTRPPEEEESSFLLDLEGEEDEEAEAEEPRPPRRLPGMWAAAVARPRVGAEAFATEE